MLTTAKNSFLLLFFVGLFFQSCNKNDVYAAEIKSLDSLSGAVNALFKEISKVDTIVLDKAILRFSQYKQFIEQNVKDTLSKSEADFVKQFYWSGRNLSSYHTNRKSIKARAVLINSQIEKLKKDAANDLIEAEKLKGFTTIEKSQADYLLEASQKQQQSYYTSLQDFKISLKGIENLIKLRNNGQLPTIVKDTLSL